MIIIATIIPIDFYYRYQHSISYKELKHFTWSLFIIFLDAFVILSLLISVMTNSLVASKFIEIEYLLFWFLLLGHTFLLLFLVALFNGLILFLWSAMRIIPNYIKKVFISFKSILYFSEEWISQPLLSNERVEKFDDIIHKTYKRIANSTLFLHFIISIFFSLHLKHFFISFYINHPAFSGSLMEMIIKDSFALYEKIFLLTLVKPFFNLFQNFFSKKEVSSHS
ncbi:hypothetical protein PT201_03515 [Erysipelothrix rhusiopathiae]|nr:hypothetical protein [Erysipelothrix rhusiopathiae]